MINASARAFKSATDLHSQTDNLPKSVTSLNYQAKYESLRQCFAWYKSLVTDLGFTLSLTHNEPAVLQVLATPGRILLPE